MKLLWIGDAVVHSGFARVTHSVLDQLHAMGWEIAVLGIVYTGDPHTYPYRIYSTFPEFGPWDPYGLTKLASVLATEKPDVIAILQDPWVVADRFVATAPRTGLPLDRTIAYMPVDSPTLRPAAMRALAPLGCSVFYTEFGRQQATRHGLDSRTDVIPHGVDLALYHPLPPGEARARNLPGLEDAFVVGCVARNQVRKRLDLALKYFAEWKRLHRDRAEATRDVYLWLHCDPKDFAGFDVLEFARYLGIADRVITNPTMGPTRGVLEADLASIYNCMDVHVSTSMGEGWNLPVQEAMACGVPNIVPRWGGLQEWAAGAAAMIPCTGTWVTPESVQAVVDQQLFVEALEAFYSTPDLRCKYAQAGLALVQEERFRWRSVAARFDAVLRSLL